MGHNNTHHTNRRKKGGTKDTFEVLTSSGFKFIRDNTDIAEDLFKTALKYNPDSFGALMGMVFAYLQRIDQEQDKNKTAVGFYLLRREPNEYRWILDNAGMKAAQIHIAYLDKAIEFAPIDLLEKLRLFRQYNVDNSYALVERMLEE